MRHPANYTHNSKLQEIIQPKTSLDRGVHFLGTEGLENDLSGEIELYAKNQYVHWIMIFAKLLNRYPILALLFRLLNALSDKKTDHTEMISRHPSASFREFLMNNQQEEKIKDFPDVIWAP